MSLQSSNKELALESVAKKGRAIRSAKLNARRYLDIHLQLTFSNVPCLYHKIQFSL